MTPQQIVTTMAALGMLPRAAGSPFPVAPPPVAFPVAPYPVLPAGYAYQSAASQADTARADQAAASDDIVSRLNASLPAGAYIPGRGIVSGEDTPHAAEPVSYGHDVRSPASIAEAVNAEHGLKPGANVPPGLAACFAWLAGKDA